MRISVNHSSDNEKKLISRRGGVGRQRPQRRQQPEQQQRPRKQAQQRNLLQWHSNTWKGSANHRRSIKSDTSATNSNSLNSGTRSSIRNKVQHHTSKQQQADEHHQHKHTTAAERSSCTHTKNITPWRQLREHRRARQGMPQRRPGGTPQPHIGPNKKQKSKEVNTPSQQARTTLAVAAGLTAAGHAGLIRKRNRSPTRSWKSKKSQGDER